MFDINTQQYLPLTVEHAKAITTGNEEEKLKSACQSFEALFLHKLMQTMRNATMEGGLIKKSHAEKIFTDMHDEELTNTISKTGSYGLAEILFNNLKLSLVVEQSERNLELNS